MPEEASGCQVDFCSSATAPALPYLLHSCSRRQLLSYMDVMNAENAGAFFRPASPKDFVINNVLEL
ncbi:MAG: hypothetical protein CVV06_17095 [Gammaproteobacteria bacterium HGW-Gammaproteobacteria-10]|nr:MAG: hypothetical protein CVV06_17095 [Gammaproteobacteria bacterium HGW-Gammaproteobacteria-10]